MSLPFSFGCLRQPEDVRDYRVPLNVQYPVRMVAEPPVVDLRPLCQFVDDQERIGSCAANAISGMIGFLFNLQKVPYSFKVSRAATYYGGRLALGTLPEDSGMRLRDGMKWVATWGIVPEDVWGYDGRPAPGGLFMRGSNTDKSLGRNASGNIDEIASEWKLKTYHLISPNVTADPAAEPTMRAVLQAGYPFVFGCEVFASWFYPVTGLPANPIPMPEPGERGIGGHAMMAVGYDDAKGCWLVRNSWGKAVGDGGYFWLPYAYLKAFGFDPWVGFELAHTP